MSSRHRLEEVLAEMAGNPEQLEAVAERGHCVVLAGPGSGKTKTLTAAMTRCLLEDVIEPRGVACITYNNECALELEGRLSRMGIEASDRIFIGTVHSFALAQVISPYAHCVFPDWPTELRIATQAEARAAVEEAYEATLDEGGDPHDRWKFASTKRKRDVDRTKPEWLGTNPELAAFIESYEGKLRGRGLIDFDDMPLLAFRMVREHAWIRDALRAQFPVLFVDEYQDLGHALHELVLTLCFEAGIRLFAVGDTDQSVYGFTGANPELLESLTKRQDVKTLRLRFNYRSGQEIIHASMTALGEERGYKARDGAPKSSILFKGVPGGIDAQAKFVIETLVPEISGRGVALDQIAVLYRNFNQGNALAAAAMVANLPVVRADTQALVRRNSRFSRLLESCARWVVGGWADADPPFRRLARDAATLVYGHSASDEERSQLEIELVSFLSSTVGRELDANAWLSEFRASLVAAWRSRARTAEDDWAAIDEMIKRTLPGAAEAGLSLAAFSGRVGGTGRLNLSTFHSAKGREFDVAILFGVNNGEIPSWRDEKRPADLRELRRLFYVGITRARRELYLVFQKDGHSPWVKELYDRVQAGV